MPAGPAAARRIYGRFIMGKETPRVNKEGTIFSQFARYVSLNVLSMAGLSCYILADTYFISAGVGSNGIAALNLALPAYSLLNGIGLMVGMGGATRYSILRGEGREDEANQVFTHAAGMAALLGILFTAAGLVFSWEIAGALGASGQVQELASIYLRTLFTFSLLFLFNNLLVCFIRNDGQPNLSMAAMLVGCLSNIVLDYVFIFPLGMGMFGAALATCAAPGIGLLISSAHFLRRKNSFRPVWCPLNGKQARGILSLGVSSLITEVSSGIVMLVFNQIILSLSGNVGVAAYGIIANLALIVVSIFTGVAQGIQPIVSRSFGSGQMRHVKQIFYYGLITSAAFGLLFLGVGWFFSQPVVGVFNQENNLEMERLASQGLPLYFLAFPMMGVNILASSYLASLSKGGPAFLLSALRGAAAVIPAVFILSQLFGLTGVWLAVPCAEALTFLVFLGMLPFCFRRPQKGSGA